MGIINDLLGKEEESEFEEILNSFIEESDYTYDVWRSESVFDYKKCVKRVVAELKQLKEEKVKIACGHTKGDLWTELHPKAQKYCTICRLHDEIDDADSQSIKWRNAVEGALGLEPDPINHNPEWAQEIILKIREIGNKK